jgi:hypothetical protein
LQGVPVKHIEIFVRNAGIYPVSGTTHGTTAVFYSACHKVSRSVPGRVVYWSTISTKFSIPAAEHAAERSLIATSNIDLNLIRLSHEHAHELRSHLRPGHGPGLLVARSTKFSTAVRMDATTQKLKQ